MKKILFILLVLNFSLSTSVLLSQNFRRAEYSMDDSSSGPLVQDGWYNATVDYENTTTHTNATYTLEIGVKSGKVVIIKFPKGGSVHSGNNNEGYRWQGGGINSNYNSWSSIVTVSDSDGTSWFTIKSKR